MTPLITEKTLILIPSPKHLDGLSHTKSTSLPGISDTKKCNAAFSRGFYVHPGLM